MSSWQPGMMLRKSTKGDNVWRQTFAHDLGEYKSLWDDSHTWRARLYQEQRSVRQEHHRAESTWKVLKREAEAKTHAERVAAAEAFLATTMQPPGKPFSEKTFAEKVYDVFGTTTEIYRSDLGDRAVEAYEAGTFTQESLNEYGPWMLLGWLQNNNTIVSVEGRFLNIQAGDMVRSLDLQHPPRLILRTEPTDTSAGSEWIRVEETTLKETQGDI